MRNRLLSISILGSTAACFGSGPAPVPSQATVMLVAPSVMQGGDVCNDSRYISSVAYSPTAGYALFEPYTPPNGNCNGTGMINASLSVVQFDLDGGLIMGTNVGPAGTSQQQSPPPIGANPNGVYWMTGNSVYTNASMGNIDLNGGSGGPSNFQPIAIVPGAANLFMLGYSQSGGFYEEPWNPQWPCCGLSNNNNMNQATLISVPLPLPASPIFPTVLAPQVTPYCDELKHCAVGNGLAVYYMEHSNNSGSIAAISSYSKVDSTISTVNTISNALSPSAIPVGLAATNQHIAWAVANSGVNLVNHQIQPGCWIYAQSTSDPPNGEALRFQSGKFSCLDVAVDDTYAYFAIVKSDEPGNCDGDCTQPIKGIGLGRVSLEGEMTFDSLSFSMAGSFSGPRRVSVSADGAWLHVADPTALAKIPITAFDGKQDIAP